MTSKINLDDPDVIYHLLPEVHISYKTKTQTPHDDATNVEPGVNIGEAMTQELSRADHIKDDLRTVKLTQNHLPTDRMGKRSIETGNWTSVMNDQKSTDNRQQNTVNKQTDVMNGKIDVENYLIEVMNGQTCVLNSETNVVNAKTGVGNGQTGVVNDQIVVENDQMGAVNDQIEVVNGQSGVVNGQTGVVNGQTDAVNDVTDTMNMVKSQKGTFSPQTEIANVKTGILDGQMKDKSKDASENESSGLLHRISKYFQRKRKHAKTKKHEELVPSHSADESEC